VAGTRRAAQEGGAHVLAAARFAPGPEPGTRAALVLRGAAAGGVAQQCLPFDDFLQPVLSYGCEVWGVDCLHWAGYTSVKGLKAWRAVWSMPHPASGCCAGNATCRSML
jgi:hypothetical protein